MQEKGNTQPLYLVHGICLDCGHVFTKRPAHGIEHMCSYCGSFDIAARRVVTEGER